MLMKRLLCGWLFVFGLLLAAGSRKDQFTKISTVTHDEKANRQRWKLMDKLVAFLALSKLYSGHHVARPMQWLQQRDKPLRSIRPIRRD